MPTSLLAPPAAPSPSAQRRTTWLQLLVGGGVGAVVGFAGFAAITRATSLPTVPIPVPALIAAILGIGFLAILLHELGHVLAGVAAGMRFISLSAGPFRFARTHAGFTFSARNRLNAWGGLAILIPPDGERLRWRLGWTFAGGPFASLLCAAAGVAVAPVGGGPLLTIWTVMHAGICLVTLIPMTSGGFVSDGGQLLALARRDTGGELRAVLGPLVGMSLQGTRPRDLDRVLLSRARSLDGPPILRGAAAAFAAAAAVDRGEPADEHFAAMADVVDALPVGQRQGFVIPIAWYHAEVRGDVELAERWETAGAGGLVDADLRALTRATILWRRGELEAARAEAERGRAAPPGIDLGGRAMVQDQLAALLARLRG